jgi:predicted PurR-regulated permease PerM
VQLGQWIGLGSLAVSLYILWQIRAVLLLLFAATILATALNQIVKLLQRFGVKRGIAIGLSLATLLAIIVCSILLIVPPVSKQLQELVDLVPQGLEKLRTWSEGLQTIIPNQLLDDIRSLKLLTQNFQQFAPRLFGNFFSLFSSSLAVVLNLLLVLILSIMLLTNPSPYRQGFIKLFPSFYRRRVDEILSKCESSLIAWVKATIFDMFIIGLVSGIGLWILQVPLPLTNGLLAGLLEFIPNLGPTLSVIPPMLLALLDAPWKAGAVLVLYLLIQQFEGNILVPIVMQKQVSLLPAVTLLSIVIFSIFFGFLGLFLSLPLTIVFQIWIKEVLVKDILNKWHGDEKDNPQQDSIIAENAEANS